MRRFAHAAVFVAVGVAAFAVGARFGALATIRILKHRAAHTATQRAEHAVDLYDEAS